MIKFDDKHIFFNLGYCIYCRAEFFNQSLKAFLPSKHISDFLQHGMQLAIAPAILR